MPIRWRFYFPILSFHLHLARRLTSPFTTLLSRECTCRRLSDALNGALLWAGRGGSWSTAPLSWQRRPASSALLFFKTTGGVPPTNYIYYRNLKAVHRIHVELINKKERKKSMSCAVDNLCCHCPRLMGAHAASSRPLGPPLRRGIAPCRLPWRAALLLDIDTIASRMAAAGFCICTSPSSQSLVKQHKIGRLSLFAYTVGL